MGTNQARARRLGVVRGTAPAEVAGVDDPPRLDRTVVARPALVARLAATRAPTLVVVTAPPGYGKSTAMALWDKHDRRRFVWVRLNWWDNHPAHLRDRLSAAAGVGGGSDDPAVPRRHQPGPAHRARPGSTPRNRDTVEDLVLVIDDLQAVAAPAARAALRDLISGLAPNVQAVLVGRTMATMALARHRLTSPILEIGPADLALSVDEAVAALTARGFSPGTDDAHRLVEATEGWVTGLHLAAMAARCEPEVARPIHRWATGRHRFLVDYLDQEILAGFDPEMLAFLEESSVLERLTAGALDTVLDRHDSGVRLAELSAHGNLLISSLDPEGSAYRYHRLLGDRLRHRLEVKDPVRARDLHRRAADWFETQGQLDEAIAHAIAGAQDERAAALVQRDALRLAVNGDPAVLAQRLEHLGAPAIGCHVNAAMAAAWYGVSQADPATITTNLRRAVSLDDGRPLADGTPDVTAGVALVRALLAPNGVSGVIGDTDVVIARGDWTTNPWWGLATAVRATAMAMIGKTAEARGGFLSALPTLGELPAIVAAGYAWLALLDLADQDLASARRRNADSWAIAARHGLDGAVATMVIYTADALVAARSGDRSRAVASIAIGERLLMSLGDTAPRTALLNHVVLAQANLALGQVDTATIHARQAEAAARREPEAVWLTDQLKVARSQIDQIRGQHILTAPLTTAELRILPRLASHHSLQEIAEQLHLSRNTVKSHSVAIYRKLGARTRSEAVEEARRAGLLAL